MSWDKIISAVEYMPGLVAAKTIDSKYYSISSAVADYLGIESPQDLLGCSDYDLPEKLTEFADIFIEYDQLVIMGEVETLSSIEILPYTCGIRLLFTRRTPLLDDSQKRIGLITQSLDVTDIDLFKTFLIFEKTKSNIFDLEKQGSYLIDSTNQDITLTHRQHDCLFFLLRGKSYKEIALILDISPRTIETHIEQLKIKFHCRTKAQLCEAAIEKGFYHRIPESLVSATF
jgi:DNA-binding CsgD family transcriptional regulator